MNDWARWLGRWADAGLIDAESARRIRAYEQEHAGSGRLRWPVLVAIGFGALMLGGGVLLFVAAHWDTLSPGVRFAIVLFMVGSFHLAGALVGERFAGLSSALHAVGTVTLGAGIALAGQIFNLDEHWPAGIMMWGAGAGAAWLLLRQAPQMIMLSILVPAWLVGEWTVRLHNHADPISTRVAAVGLFLTALTYFTLPPAGASSSWRRGVRWVGGIALLPAAAGLAATVRGWGYRDPVGVSTTTMVVGWLVAVGLPLGAAAVVRRTEAWPHAAAALWALALLAVEPVAGRAALYVWWALGAIGLVAWGVREGHTERVNMGAALFAATVMAFYFSQVMDKLGRSASLVGLGLLFLAGGWMLERLRRRLVLQAEGTR
jgi:uncharacterized membrane protein